MIIGHLPAGYVVSRLLFSRFKERAVNLKPFLWAGILGALAPDFDMVYFHLIDNRQHHHHTYWSHFPIVWGTLLVLSVAWLCASKSNRPALALIFSLNGLIHMGMDTIVGDIWWFAPFIDKPFALFSVPALYKPWWLNFLLHWSFALELAVVAWAVYLWRCSLTIRPQKPGAIKPRSAPVL